MFKALFFTFLLTVNFLFSAQENVISLRGYLGQEELDEVFNQVVALRSTRGGELVVQIDSSSGDLDEVLHLSNHIQDLKMSYGKLIVVYIQGKAVGPAAVFPFLADQLITTPLAAWGDIPYGVKKEAIPHSLIKTVQGLINKKSQRVTTLEPIVEAMVDPHAQLVFGRDHEVLSTLSQASNPLILNVQGIQALNLLDGIVTDEDFSQTYLHEQSGSVFSDALTSKISPETLWKMLSEHVSLSDTEDNLIGYLNLRSIRPINEATYIYTKFALEAYKEQNVKLIVMDLNSAGGDILSTLKIADLLQKCDLQDRIPVIAFIDEWALATGAMLPLACRFIAVTPSSLMGANQPELIRSDPNSKPVKSALQAEFAALASFYQRNPLVAEAMVDPDMILVIRNHRLVKLQNEKEMIQQGPNPDIVVSERGRLLSLNAEELLDVGYAQISVPQSKSLTLTAEERSEGKWPASKMALFNTPFLKKISHATMVSYRDWRVGAFRVLMHPIIAALLVFGFIIGAYIEINTSRFGFPGVIALICLVLILVAAFVIHTVHWVEIAILIVGLTLLLLELFVIPGFGVTGIVGIILTICGLVTLLLPGISKLSLFDLATFELVGFPFIQRLGWLLGSILSASIVIFLLAKHHSAQFFRFSKSALVRGQTSSIHDSLPKPGEVGESVTALSPRGKVHIKENLYDAVIEGEPIGPGTPVEVVHASGRKIVVRKVENKNS